MLYVFFGNDTSKVRQSALEKLADLQEKFPDLMVEKIEVEDYVPSILINAISNTALFSGRIAYYLDQPSENIEFFNEVRELASALNSSINYFIISDGNFLAEDKKIFKTTSSEIIEYKKETSKTFNIFQMTDALVNCDKRTLWFLLQEAKSNGLSAEEIIGTLWWQLKVINLAEKTRSASEAGIKDFPYNKAKRALKNFKQGQIANFTRGLLALYHDGHHGKRDINLALEEWVLKL